MSAVRAMRRKGSPLAMLAVVLGSWVAGRAATWDGPLSVPMLEIPDPQAVLFADKERSSSEAGNKTAIAEPAPQSVAYQHFQDYPQYADYPEGAVAGRYGAQGAIAAEPSGPDRYADQRYAGYQSAALYRPARYRAARAAPQYASPEPIYDARPTNRRLHGGPSTYSPTGGRVSDHQLLMREAFGVDWHSAGVRSGPALVRKQGDKRQRAARQAPAPYIAQRVETTRPAADRWSLDVYGFYRQGSNALSVTQGRMPIYGASQVGANLQWRARPSSAHDPRLFARAYHALVTGGESEVAAGVSARPIGSVPIRAYGEVRVTRNPAIAEADLPESYDVRPAAYAVTEFPRFNLPLGIGLEAYAAGGYVGGNADTYFVDGQAALVRELARLGNPGKSQAALSLGGGVWGGAQKDANRVDVGPTVRLDLNIGEVPARVSVDYREQVAGDADPSSGVAATVSTQF